MRNILFKYSMTNFCFVIALLWAIPAFANDYLVIIEEGLGLSASAAEGLERTLLQNPEDLNARAFLIGYYYGHPLGSSRQSRVQQIGWLIEHHPDSAILRHHAATMTAADFKQPSPADLPTMVAAWQRQVNAHPGRCASTRECADRC